MIGFGTWGLSGKDYGFISAKKSKNLILKSVNSGIKFFDTAPLYGNGKVEKILGEAIKENKGLRKKITICTKFGLLPHKNHNLKHDFSYNHVKKEISKSLKNLNSNYIDIYLMHSPNLDELNIKKILIILNKLKRSKKIKYFGISLKDPSDIFKLKNLKLFDYFEMNFNLLDQRAAKFKIIEFLKKKEKKIICRTPLCFGFLSDGLIIKNKLNRNDHRRKFWPKTQFDRWNENKNLFNYYKKKYRINKLSIFAILFCLSYKFDYVIPGIMSDKQLRENLRASRFKKITNKDLKEILGIYLKKEKKIFKK